MESLLDRVAELERAQRSAAREARGWRSVTLALLVMALAGGGLLGVRPSHAQVGGIPAQIAALQAAVTGLQTKVTNLQTALAKETADRQAADTSLENAVDFAVADLVAIDEDLQNQVNPLTDKLSHFSVDTIDGYYSVVLTGANLHIRNGLGATSGNPLDQVGIFDPVTNGLGNLIIGYNDSRAINFETDNRTGSHNLILGTAENYTSFGGLVAGRFSEISAPYASVVGGNSNTAKGNFALVSGGEQNTAGGDKATVSGGYLNVAAIGFAASVSGGKSNVASGNFASISGGESNFASGNVASISGGSFIFQSNDDGWSAGSNGATVTGSFRSP